MILFAWIEEIARASPLHPLAHDFGVALMSLNFVLACLLITVMGLQALVVRLHGLGAALEAWIGCETAPVYVGMRRSAPLAVKGW